ncbi:hypothetical protein V7O62_07195 [Methanolobus sp. ZRKC2]|uniref:hypothetical protein n=1 Tax=Methanolobus sp. ZRKC2 TaxID=3125783 RepID=UPI00324656E4
MKLLDRKITLPFTIMLILLSLTAQGAYAIDSNNTKEEIPPIDVEDIKEKSLEMIDRNIESLESLQSETDGNELNDSIDDLLEQLETLKSELESAEEDEAVYEIRSTLMTLIEESPEEIKEALMENGMGGGKRGSEGKGINGMEDAEEEQQSETEGENNSMLSDLINKIMSLFQ